MYRSIKEVWVLTTTTDQPQWYAFDRNNPSPETYGLVPGYSDLTPTFNTKDEAKDAAKKLGLKTWRYKRITPP